jgi:hypothetical protein
MRWLLLLALCGSCADDEPPPDDTDVEDTDDTDLVDTDVGDTDDTDVADTDPPTVLLTCGEEVCDGALRWCEVTYAGEEPDTDAPPVDETQCVDLPAACVAAPTCACLEAEGVLQGFGACSGDATTGLTVVFSYP